MRRRPTKTEQATADKRKYPANNSSPAPSPMGGKTTGTGHPLPALSAPPRPFRPFPVELLPQPVARYVEAVSQALPCNPAYVALPALATLAAAVGMSRVLRIKRTWTEPPVLWAAVVGYSGTVKSPAEELASRPLVEVEHELGDQHRTADRQYRADLENRREDCKGPNDTPPTPPVPRRAVVGDITIEGLGVILGDNPKGVLVRRDELRGWFESFTRYSRASDAPQWLELHRGGALIIDRKTGDRKTIRVANAAASVSGGIQPDILARSLTREAFASGLAARLLLAMPPREPKRWTDDDVPDDVAAGYAAVVRALWALDPEAGAGGRPTPFEVPLSEAARKEFAPFVDSWGERTAVAGGNLAAAFSKLEGYAARFALVHHLVQCVAAGRDGRSPVSAASMRAGIGLANWFADETERVYAALVEDEAARQMRELVEVVRRHGNRISPRELQRHNGRRYSTVDEAEQALKMLAAAGWGCWEETPPAGGGHPKRELVLCPTHDTSDTRSDSPGPARSAPRDTRPGGGTEAPPFQEDSGRVSEVSCVGRQDQLTVPPPAGDVSKPVQQKRVSDSSPTNGRPSRRRFGNDDRPHEERG